MRRFALLLAIPFVFAAAACEATNPSFPVIVRTLADDGKPMAAVQIKIANTIGATDAEGKWAVRLSGLEGSEVPISAEPPRGYRIVSIHAAAQKGVVLRKVVGVDGKLVPVEHTIKMAPLERTYAVLVKTGFAGLPVETFGHKQVLTGESGTASFLYHGTPGDELQVRISTADHPLLRPTNPTQTFVLGQQSDAYVVQTKFAMPKPVAAPKVNRKPIKLGPKRL